MNKDDLISFYKRDIQKLIEEINLFTDEKNIWKTHGSIKNSTGNLILHLIGGLNYLIGTTLGNTSYFRNRDAEFTIRGITRDHLIRQLDELSLMIEKTISAFSAEELGKPFPIYFDKENTTVDYVLTQLLLHLNYHLGQINYLRRALE